MSWSSPQTRFDSPVAGNCAELIVRQLSLLDIPCVFGVPGGNIDPFVCALARHASQSGVRWILSRSEAGAGFMADGFARESGSIGVCSATSGPGCTNLLTPVSNAFVDGVPLLVITGQNSTRTFGRGAMQEVSASGADTMLMFRGCTRYNALVTHPAQLEHNLLAALSHATGPTPGPVHISIPQDILSNPVQAERNEISRYAFFGQAVSPDRCLLNRLETLLRAHRRGAIVIGGGCRGAMHEILSFAEHRDWPLVATPTGRGLLPTDHPLFRGVFGTAGHESARLALMQERSTIVLAVGVNLDEHATCGWDGSTILSRRLLHVNSNPEYLARSHMARMNLLGSPREVFRHLNRKLVSRTSTPAGAEAAELPPRRDRHGMPLGFGLLHADDCLLDATPINPRRLFWWLGQQVPPRTRLFADAGNSFFWAPHYWHPRGTRVVGSSLLQLSMSFAAMGWAIGAAIGAKIAKPREPVICITGDGAWLMHGQEISVAQELGLNVVFVVLNNGVLGTVRHGQRMRGLESTANTLPRTDFAMMAQAMGVEAYRVRKIADIERIGLESLFSREGPVLLDVIVDPDVAPPIGQRIRNLD